MSAHEHSIPCTQEDAIKNLQENHREFADKLERINHTIHGNGDGIGMKTDLALVVQRTEGIEKLLSGWELKKSNNIGLWIAGISLLALLVFGLWDHFKNTNENKELADEKKELKEMMQEIKTLNAGTRAYKPPLAVGRTFKQDSIRNDSVMRRYR